MGKSVQRVVQRYIEGSVEDPYLTVEEIADLCPKCAHVLVTEGREGIQHSGLRQMMAAKGDKWQKMPKGWTSKSREEFWESLTGDVKHKVTKCIKQMEDKVDDPGAFCASLADRVDPGWRSREARKVAPPPPPVNRRSPGAPKRELPTPRVVKDYEAEAESKLGDFVSSLGKLLGVKVRRTGKGSYETQIPVQTFRNVGIGLGNYDDGPAAVIFLGQKMEFFPLENPRLVVPQAASYIKSISKGDKKASNVPAFRLNPSLSWEGSLAKYYAEVGALGRRLASKEI